jgi:hypothetical protein
MSVLKGEQEWLEQGIVADNCEMGIDSPPLSGSATLAIERGEMAGVV